MFGVLGTLGPLPFICSHEKVQTFSGLSRELSSRWAKHDVLHKKPVLEWVGDELASISLSIRFDSFLGSPPAEGLAELKKMLESREAHVLVIGGSLIGKFVIESISEERKFHTGAGVCQVAEAKLSLKECG